MNVRSTVSVSLAAALSAMLAACASTPTATIARGPDRPAHATARAADDSAGHDAPQDDGRPRPEIRRGTGQVINRDVASAPLPDMGATGGEVTFNFEGEPLHAVVKAILGDSLGQNYTIAPGVQGTVTFATPKKISPAQQLSVLEMILAWNNARMIYSDGRYNIVPADQALANGVVSPRSTSPQSARGFESRVVPLRYISATEMEKLLKPFARPNAIVTVDAGRNLLTLAGTRAELESYLRTIETFDVDWMASMSVGVFPLQSGKASKVVADLEKVFGEQSKSPVAGMFRFMPLEGANAVLAITPQPDYLDDIQQWIERIDGAGQGVTLHSYELKYITAKEIAARLSEVFGGRGGGSGISGGGDSGGVSLIPGGSSSVIASGDGPSKDGGGYDGSGINPGGGGGGGGGLGGGSLSLNSVQNGGPSSVTLEVGGDKVGVSAIEENNTLLVRCTGASWRSILDVIEKLDVMPLQVHIEAQVAQVQLGGQLKYGVSWFLENATTDNDLPDVTTRGMGTPSKWSTFAGSIGGKAGSGLAWTLIKNDAAAVISALDEVTDVKLLQTPSILVRNNQEATLNVGDRIPVVSTSVNPTQGNTGTISQVQYLDTGTILKVRPRVTQDGTVFIELVQEVSAAKPTADPNGNRTISTNRLKTSAVAQSGDTILLAGLISDTDSKTGKGLPGLSRIPVVGGLFGQQGKEHSRSEIIILLTATIVRDQDELRTLTDEYSRRFRAMAPLPPPKKLLPRPPQPHR